MPSKEYLDMLKKESGDPLPPIESTKKEKAKDFWYYHRMIFIVGGFIVAFVGFLIYDILTQVHPDVEVALLTDQAYTSESILTALEADIAPFCEDYNGDGVVTVNINLYNPSFDATDENIDPNMQMATVTKLMGDLSTMSTTIFLTDVYDEAQELYQIFSVQGDVETLSENVEETGPLINETAMIPLTTEFTDPVAQQQYEYYHENLIVSTRFFILENLNDEQFRAYVNSVEVYDNIVG